jgi:hypothetical protein
MFIKCAVNMVQFYRIAIVYKEKELFKNKGDESVIF